MAKIDDGGPAFPNVDSDERVGVFVGDRGMSLRDFFAAFAINGIQRGIIELEKRGKVVDHATQAAAAYALADAMIAERNKR